MAGGGAGIRKFNLRMSQVRKRWKIGLSQSLIYTNPFPPLIPQFFYPLQIRSQKKYSSAEKILEGHLAPLPPAKLRLWIRLNSAGLG
jgi:hypothetical protein